MQSQKCLWDIQFGCILVPLRCSVFAFMSKSIASSALWLTSIATNLSFSADITSYSSCHSVTRRGSRGAVLLTIAFVRIGGLAKPKVGRGGGPHAGSTNADGGTTVLP